MTRAEKIYHANVNYEWNYVSPELKSNILKAIEQALNMHIVMPELLCIDSKDATWLTDKKIYKMIDVEEENYLVLGDVGLKNWYSKTRFKVIEAQ